MDLSIRLSMAHYLAVCLLVSGCAGARSIEHDLIYRLTLPSNYDVNALPVASAEDAVHVTIDIGLRQIIDLDEPSQKLTTSILLRLYWTDVSLTWDPRDHGNVTSLCIYATRIWRPDITLYNDLRTEERDVEELYPTVVTHDGNVSWFMPAIFISSCQLDMTYFPFDTQNCRLELGSCTYDGSKLTLSSKASFADTSIFLENGEYDLDNASARREPELYTVVAEPYDIVVYTLKLTRKPMFYIFNLILPCMFISFVGLFVFVLPPSCGEKVSLSVTVLLATTVFLMIVAESVPPQSSTVPLVSRYFQAVLLMLALTTIMTVLVINIHHRRDQYGRPPRLVRCVLLEWMATLVFMRSLVIRNTKSRDFKRVVKIATQEGNGMEKGTSVKETVSLLHTCNEETNIRHIYSDSSMSNQLLHNILQELRNQNTMKSEVIVSDNKTPSHTEWELIAMVLDRVFLICFLIVFVVTTLAILLR